MTLAETLLGMIPSACFALASNFEIVHCNDRSEALFAEDRAPLPGRRFPDLFDGARSGEVSDFLDRVVAAGGREIAAEFPQLGPGGGLRLTGRPVGDTAERAVLVLTAEPLGEVERTASERVEGSGGARTDANPAQVRWYKGSSATLGGYPGAEVGIRIWDLTRNKMWHTPTGGTDLGYDMSGVDNLAEFYASLIADEDLADLDKVTDRAIREGRPHSHILPVRASDGRLHQFLIRGEPEIAEDGTVTRIIVTETDITEFVEMNKRLLHGEEIARFGSWWRRMDEDLVYRSPGLTRLYGLEPRADAATAAEMLAMTHPDDREHWQQTTERLLAAWREQPGTVDRVTCRIIRADGELRYFHVSSTFDLDAGGEPYQTVGTVQDITEQVVLNEKLLRAERIAKLGNFTRRVGTDTVILSPELCRLLGSDPARSSLSQAEILQSIHPEDRDMLSRRQNSLMVKWLGAPGTIDRLRVRIVRPDGAIRFCEVTMTFETGMHGEPHTMIGTAQDITDLVTAEHRLLQSQQNEVIGQLAGGAAHDFNNWLAIIMGNLELLRREPLPEICREFVRDALDATRRGAALTRSLLSLARRADLDPIDLDAGAVIAGMRTAIAGLLPDSVTLDIGAADGLWTLHADRAALENAVLNLVINARDAMPDGGTVGIEMRNEMLTEPLGDDDQGPIDPGPYVVISVSDTGSGVPPDLLSEIFAPYFTTKPQDMGSGLGLPMVQGFVRQSGGGLRLTSEVGAGTVVKLFLPAQTSTPEPLEDADRS